MLDKDDLEMWERVSQHLTRMENDPEYCKEIEAQLYRGAPKELLERLEKEVAEELANGQNSVSE